MPACGAPRQQVLAAEESSAAGFSSQTAAEDSALCAIRAMALANILASMYRGHRNAAGGDVRDTSRELPAPALEGSGVARRAACMHPPSHPVRRAAVMPACAKCTTEPDAAPVAMGCCSRRAG
jgi:hypothetical protein